MKQNMPPSVGFRFFSGRENWGETQAMTVAFIDVECCHSLQCKITAKSLA
jgi:hypothetical protein